MKKVKFLGETYTVPKIFKYIALDSTGDVFVYEHKPELDTESGDWDSTSGRYMYLGKGGNIVMIGEI